MPHSTMASIELREEEVLRWIHGFLRQRGWLAAAHSLEAECGVSSHKAAVQLRQLRALVVRGRFQALADLLKTMGLSKPQLRAALYAVYVQQYLEAVTYDPAEQESVLLSSPLQSADDRQENLTSATLNCLLDCLTQIQRVAPSNQAFLNMCQVLAASSLQDVPEVADWSRDKGREDLFHRLSSIIVHGVGHASTSTGSSDTAAAAADSDTTEAGMRLPALLARGLLHEQFGTGPAPTFAIKQHAPVPHASVATGGTASGGAGPVTIARDIAVTQARKLFSEKQHQQHQHQHQQQAQSSRRINGRGGDTVSADHQATQARLNEQMSVTRTDAHTQQQHRRQQQQQQHHQSAATVQAPPRPVESSTPARHARPTSNRHTASVPDSHAAPAAGGARDQHGSKRAATHPATSDHKMPANPHVRQARVSSSRRRKDRIEVAPLPSKLMSDLVGVVEDVQAVRSLAFHPDGEVAAIGANSQTLRICSVHSTPTAGSEDMLDQPMLPILFKARPYHRGSIYCLEWSPDGALLASGSNDKTLRVLSFDTDTCEGSVLHELRPGNATVRCVTFMSNTTVACGGAGGASDFGVALYDVQAAEQLLDLAGHQNQITGLRRVNNDVLLACSLDAHVTCWDTRSASRAFSMQLSAPTTCVTSDSNHMYLGDERGFISVYDLRSRQLVKAWQAHTADCRFLDLDRTRGGLLSSSYDGTVRVTALSAGPFEEWSSAVIAQHRDKVIQARWHPAADIRSIVSAGSNSAAGALPRFMTSSADKTAKLWQCSSMA